MKEEYIEAIEEALCGEELADAIADAFNSIYASSDFDPITTIEVTQAQYDALPKPTPTGTLYLITDA